MIKDMRKIVIIAAIAVTAGGATLSWLVLKNQPAPNNETAQPITKNAAVDPEEHNYADSDFAKRMIVHNQQGIQMAEIAKKNAEDEDVRQLAASIREALSNSTEQYSKWLTEWNEEYFELSYFPEEEGHDAYPTHPGMASLNDLHSLRSATGSAVDEQFLRLMIAHHEGAAEMAEGVASDRMQFGAMISLKNETLNNQANEVQRMKLMLTNRK